MLLTDLLKTHDADVAQRAMQLVVAYDEAGCLVYAGANCSLPKALETVVALGLAGPQKFLLHRCPRRAWREVPLHVNPLCLMRGADA